MIRHSNAAFAAALTVAFVLAGVVPAGADSHVPPAWLRCKGPTVPTQIGLPGVTTGRSRRRWICLNPGPNPGLKCKTPLVARFVHNDKTGYGYWSCVQRGVSRGGGVRK